MRSRLVWDPAHIVYLESWYGRETRYPNLVQCQAYANQLSRVPQSGKFHSSVELGLKYQTKNQMLLDQSGKSRTSMSVTAQNVSHWFQNRRRKDTHPEIEEKRVKRSQTRRTKKSNSGNPLDLTQSTAPRMKQSITPPLNCSPQEPSHHPDHDYRDSDDEPGLCIAENAHNSYNSDTENDHPSIHHPHYQV